jgi:DNA polymerase-3 subunit delta
VCGDDDYRRAELTRRLPTWVLPGGGGTANVTSLDGREVAPIEVLTAIESEALPFFDTEHRVVVIRDCLLLEGKLPKEAGSLVSRVAAGLPCDLTLILEAPTDAPKGELYDACAASGVVLRFAKIAKAAEVGEFIEERLRYAGVRIDRDALDLLQALAPPDSGLLTSEIRKLVAYVGEEGRVTSDDVRKLVARTRETVVFEISDALGERDIGRALGATRDLMHQGHGAVAIVALLASRLRLLLVARALMDRGLVPEALLRSGRCDNTFKERWTAVAQQAKPLMPEDRAANLAAQHPFVVFKTLREARSFSAAELAAGIRAAADADLALKSTTGLGDADIVESLVIGLCRAEARPLLSGLSPALSGAQ